MWRFKYSVFQSQNYYTSLHSKIRQEAIRSKWSSISGPPLDAILKDVDGITYAHKGNVEKHIRSGSLHQWTKDKFSRKESDTQSQPKPLSQTTLTQCVAESVKRNFTCLFNTAFLLVMAEKSFADFPFVIKMQKRNDLNFLPGKDDEHSCSIFVHFLAEALRSDIKWILLLSNFFAGEMDGSEAQKTKDEKELVYCKVVICGQPVELFLKCQKMTDFGGVDAACTKQDYSVSGHVSNRNREMTKWHYK